METFAMGSLLNDIWEVILQDLSEAILMNIYMFFMEDWRLYYKYHQRSAWFLAHLSQWLIGELIG